MRECVKYLFLFALRSLNKNKIVKSKVILKTRYISQCLILILFTEYL